MAKGESWASRGDLAMHLCITVVLVSVLVVRTNHTCGNSLLFVLCLMFDVLVLYLH